jgi:hypothetical protein
MPGSSNSDIVLAWCVVNVLIECHRTLVSPSTFKVVLVNKSVALCQNVHEYQSSVVPLPVAIGAVQLWLSPTIVWRPS